MRWQPLALVAVVLTLVVAEALRDDATEKDTERVQGAWRVTAATRGGKDAPAKAIANAQFVFAGNKVTARGVREGPATFELDATKKPAAITIKDDKATIEGIYQVDGDTLIICFNKPGEERPTAFVSKADTEIVLLVLRRQKQ
jgi:uncharacterized protein (TIGR03067 family)